MATIEYPFDQLIQAGGLIGLGVNIYVMDKYGRKMGLIFASLMGLLGAAGTTGARNVAMFIVFRFFAGWGSWAALCVGMRVFIFLSRRVSSSADTISKGQHTPLSWRRPKSAGFLSG